MHMCMYMYVQYEYLYMYMHMGGASMERTMELNMSYNAHGWRFPIKLHWVAGGGGGAR